MGTFSTNLLLSILAFGESAANGFDNWGESANFNFNRLDAKLGNKTTHSLAGGDITLSATAEASLFVVLTGTINSDRTVNISARPGFWIFSNDTGGGYEVSLAPADGGPCLLPSGTALVYSDGNEPVVVSGGSQPACFFATKTANQSLSTPGVLSFNDEKVDVGGYYDPTTYRWTPPAGIYEVTLSCQLQTSNAPTGLGPNGEVLYGATSSTGTIAIRKNGTVVVSARAEIWSNPSEYAHATATAIVEMNGTDYIDAYGSGAAVNVFASMSGGWSGASTFSGKAL